MSNVSKPIVSICCATYNHEKYIADALEGFVTQRTNFPFEVLVHDDASTDGTAGIIREYAKKYPEIIKPIFQKENQYSKGINITFTYNFPRIKGKYIALCEGDDYWTDRNKLQKQVDFLEKNPKFTLCFTGAAVRRGDAIDDMFIKEVHAHILDKRSTFGLRDILAQNFVTTCTAVYRVASLTASDELRGLTFGDWALHVTAARSGEIKYLPEITAVYRIHDKGVWSSKSEYSRNELIFKFYDFLRTYLDKDERALFLEVLCKRMFDYMNHAAYLAESIQSLKDENASQVKMIDVAQAELSNLKEVNEHRAKKIDQLREDNILAKKIQKDAIETLQTELSHYKQAHSKFPWRFISLGRGSGSSKENN